MSNGYVKRLPAVFYGLPSGREPVREWLKSLSDADRKIIGEDIKDIEFDWPVAHVPAKWITGSPTRTCANA